MSKSKIKIDKNTLVIIDIKKIMLEYMQQPVLRRFFRYVPIKELIMTLLSVSHYIDYSEPVYHLLEKRLHNLDDDILDYDVLLILIESLVLDLDELINEAIELDSEDYYLAEDILADGGLVLEVKK